MTDDRVPDLDQLGRAGAQALSAGDAHAARSLFERVTAARPGDVDAWYGLAVARGRLGDEAAHLRAVDQVLAGAPGHLPALMMKADHYARIGDRRAAQTFYRAAVARAPPMATLSPHLQGEVRRAARLCEAHTRAFEAHLRGAVARAGFDPAVSSPRFAQAIDLMLGRKKVYLQSPTSFYFPELPHRQFYERAEFPWLAALEARTGEIRAELAALAGDAAAFRPYVQTDPARPTVEFGDLRDNPAWGAFHLIESGVATARARALCPATLAALKAAPLCRAAGRTPSVLFSRLAPGTRIPPHNGQINARLICHLPLIVPPGCGLRVGNETRSWVPGETLIFDDTIEHEAWNTSGQARVVLLFDIWRPELDDGERALVAALLSAVGEFGDGTPP
jgi:aspartyl/asparaginyl beta-hydroxylase (cupin superfamily)